MDDEYPQFEMTVKGYQISAIGDQGASDQRPAIRRRGEEKRQRGGAENAEVRRGKRRGNPRPTRRTGVWGTRLTTETTPRPR
jgi:hypothetical protein